MKTRLIVPLSLAGLLAACGGPRAVTRGTHEDPNTLERLSDPFNEDDQQLIARKVVKSLANSPRFARPGQQLPVVLVGGLKNKTSEHIDMSALGDKIQTGLARTGRFALLDKVTREALAEEYAARGPGEQASADYVLTGELSSIVQKAGNDRLVHYRMTTKLNNARTGVVEWTDEEEVRKQFEKMPVTW
uniref:Penicillin-binding protein activator LpoB n=1 Tax=Vitiosangium cumulatum TaxID=1867796 RepID=A0A7D5BGA9_9BACT|nr:membrane lipoprotein lipid attachment SitE [Vitiosangium cumulatum]